MLALAARRPREASGYLLDHPDWPGLPIATKRRFVAHEWLVLYEGPDAGPMTRFTEDQWEAIFDEVGYFSVHHLLREIAPGKFTETLTVRPAEVPPSPFPTLYRSAPPEWRDRWSWTPMLLGAKTLHRPGTKIWTHDGPEKVFMHITELKTVLPGSDEEPIIFEEYVVRPGVVTPFTPPTTTPRKQKP